MGHRFRKLRWPFLLAWSAVEGLIVRALRRVRHRRPRIVHGTYPMHMIRDMVAADRLAGYSSQSVVFDLRIADYGLVIEDDFDLVLNTRGYALDELHWAAICYLLKRADIWVTFFDSIFFPESHQWKNRFVLNFVHLLGIRIVVTPGGLDVVHLLPEKSRYDWVGRVRQDYPNWNLEEETPKIRRRIADFSRSADLVVSADSATDKFLPRIDLAFKPFAVAIRPPTASSAPNDPPVVLHAPNHRNIKGTSVLLEAVRAVNTRGVRLEVKLLERVPRERALEVYASADILADQFCIGAFGVFALEGLELGKPVCTYLDREQLGNPVFNLPIVNCTHENLARVLAVLAGLPELRRRIGDAGRLAVARYQSIEAMAEIWSRIYEHVWWGRALNVETTRVFSADRQPRSFSEDPADPEFWPVPAEDLLPAILSVLHSGVRDEAASRL
jgi:glycosyltransferase involved in cell wall biosynthesis